MIFVTLGSQKFQFNRLLKKIDDLIEDKTITEGVFAQTGVSDYIPRNYSGKAFLDRDEFSEMISRCDIIITHGGTGAIVSGVKSGKKVIAVPRLAKYGEHIDDHQLQIIDQFEESNLILSCVDCDKLEDVLRKVKSMKFNTYQSNTQRIIDSIEHFLTKIESS